MILRRECINCLKLLRKNYMLNETDKDKHKFVNFVHKYNDKVAGVIIEPLVQEQEA